MSAEFPFWGHIHFPQLNQNVSSIQLRKALGLTWLKWDLLRRMDAILLPQIFRTVISLGHFDFAAEISFGESRHNKLVWCCQQMPILSEALHICTYARINRILFHFTLMRTTCWSFQLSDNFIDLKSGIFSHFISFLRQKDALGKENVQLYTTVKAKSAISAKIGSFLDIQPNPGKLPKLWCCVWRYLFCHFVPTPVMHCWQSAICFVNFWGVWIDDVLQHDQTGKGPLIFCLEGEIQFFFTATEVSVHGNSKWSQWLEPQLKQNRHPLQNAWNWALTLWPLLNDTDIRKRCFPDVADPSLQPTFSDRPALKYSIVNWIIYCVVNPLNYTED